MGNSKDVWRIIGIALLSIFVLTVVFPIAFAIVGITLIKLVSLAVFLIKIAVVIAVIYLVLAGVRALLSR